MTTKTHILKGKLAFRILVIKLNIFFALGLKYYQKSLIRLYNVLNTIYLTGL